MNLQDYERSGQATYAGLAETVAAILASAVARDASLRLQQIQNRSKDVASLQRKLEKAKAAASDEIEPHAKDLAGARLIFYTNSDVARFQSSGILTGNFEVDWARTKIHHPTSESAAASELFVSNNYVVRLKADRAGLPEYARFADLWCEVQVQTTLNHAWAEMAHDTIYKKPVLAGFGGQLMDGIEERMKVIMRDYLAPAGYAFQKVLNDFERLSRGKALFEQGVIAAMDGAADNNELHETLEKFSNSVLPYYDDYEAISADLLTALARNVGRAHSMPVRAVATPFGDIPGKTAKDVAESAARIIRDLRFIDVEQTFSLLSDLFLGARGTDEEKVWTKLAKELSENNLHVWKQAGPAVQMLLVERIRALTDERRLELKPLIFVILTEVFSADLSGTTSNFDSITIHQGAVAPSDALRQMRRDALEILHRFDSDQLEDADRRELISVYRAAMSMPHLARTERPELTAIILENAADIVARHADQAAGWPYELRQKVEHDLLWTYRNHGKSPPPELTNAVAEEARKTMVGAIRAFRDRVNADDGFTTYKLLVGFESVFPPAWDDAKFDYTAEEKYRADQIDSVVAEINEGNASKWLAIIQRCAATQSNDLATFPTFAKFLEKLAHTHPHIVLGYFCTIDARLATFLSPMLRGLSQTEQWDDALVLVRAWITEGRYLSDVAWAAASVNALTVELLTEVFEAALKAGDEDAVFSVLRSISARDADDPSPSLKPLFLRSVDLMAQRGNPRWVRVWWSKKGSRLLAELTGDEAATVLSSLVAYPEVEYRLEDFLADVAHSHPQAVIDYFGKRLEWRSSDDLQGDYEAIPYRLHQLNVVLAAWPQLLVRAARGWYADQPEYFTYYGGRLIEATFPDFSPELQTELRPYMESGNGGDIEFVIEVLGSYSGQSFLQPLGQDLVAKLPADDPLLNRIEGALEPSGVTTGEFGRVLRMKEHRDQMATWLDDEREIVRDFSIRCTKHLDAEIAAEQRRSEESVALRKLEYERQQAPTS